MPTKRKNSKAKRSPFFLKLIKKIGPGLVTGAADDDPSGIATYSQAGAQFGFQLLWLSFISLPLVIVVQEMCARIGVVTGVGLTANIRKHYPRLLILGLILPLLLANIFNIAADLSVIGASLHLLLPGINIILIIFFFGLLSTVLQIFIPYKIYSKYLKFLALVLLVYPLSTFFIKPHWKEVLLATFIPSISFSKDQFILICAILGTTISPYLFFWETSQQVEEKIDKQQKSHVARKSTDKTAIKLMRIDVIFGMFISNLIMFFIILICGAVLHEHGITNIEDAAEAAAALKPIAGSIAETLFAFGIIGTGMLAIPVLAGSGAYAFAEIFHLKEGLYRKFSDSYGFYGVILFSMIIAFALNLIGLNPIKALIYSAVFNGILAPIVLFFIVRVANKHSVMGTFANSKVKSVLGWIIIGIMSVSGVAAIGALIF